ASYRDVEVMRDAVAGSTSGRLTLTQDVVARGTIASLDATNPGGGDLTVDVTARGPRGSSAGPHGGSAVVESVTATAAGSVDVLAVAEGGDSGGTFDPPVAAGVGEIRQVVGRSTGGAPVTVRAHAAGGGNGYLATGGVADASLVNAVSAETSGAITLEQIAEGGVAEGFSVGNQGNGSSHLDADYSSAFLDVRSPASGRIAEATS